MIGNGFCLQMNSFLRGNNYYLPVVSTGYLQII
jgi:hypothetical protein